MVSCVAGGDGGGSLDTREDVEGERDERDRFCFLICYITRLFLIEGYISLFLKKI
ncbi:hypothetical protein Hanom_Chr04g00354521 [Helianthus anomalus]